MNVAWLYVAELISLAAAAAAAVTIYGEGNGNPFQYSCLEIPMDGGDW